MKTILITGATAGIGRHAALHFARQGERVFATGRNEEALAKLQAEAAGTRLETLRLDVTDPASIAAARDEVLRRTDGHGIDVLVNNAGYGLVGPIEELSERDLRRQFDTNVFGLVAVTQAFVPAMRARGGGRVVNVSSVGGRITFPFMGAYHATKYAVEALSDALRVELRSFGIEVVLIEPGPIRTDFADRAMSFVDQYRRPDSPYAAAIERADELRTLADRQAVGPEAVTRAMERAIRARRPRARYVMPFSSRLLLVAARVLPTRWLDALMARLSGLTRRRLLTAKPEGSPALPAAR